MTKFRPDSMEARAWVQFMAVSLSRVHVASSAIQADAALEEFKKRLDEDAPGFLTKDQRAILKSASKVARVKFRTGRRKAMAELVTIGFLNPTSYDGFYAITPAGREAIK